MGAGYPGPGPAHGAGVPDLPAHRPGDGRWPRPSAAWSGRPRSRSWPNWPRWAKSTHLQLANEAAHPLRQSGTPPYRHILVDEAQDLNPSQWRLLRRGRGAGPCIHLFIAADPHQRIYDNRVSLASLGISVQGRSRRLSLNYRTTQEILAWAVPLLGAEPVTGLDGEANSPLGYRFPCAASARSFGWRPPEPRNLIS